MEHAVGLVLQKPCRAGQTCAQSVFANAAQTTLAQRPSDSMVNFV
jgi:hypothetical protein